MVTGHIVGSIKSSEESARAQLRLGEAMVRKRTILGTCHFTVTQGRMLISAHRPGHGICPGEEGTMAGGVRGSWSPSTHNLGAGEMNAGVELVPLSFI